jgi:hypothetical protein
MSIKKLFPLFLIAVLSLGFFSGCASHSAQGKSETIILGGLLEVNKGTYDRQGPLTVPINMDEAMPGSELPGNNVSILWGLISYTNQ